MKLIQLLIILLKLFKGRPYSYCWRNKKMFNKSVRNIEFELTNRCNAATLCVQEQEQIRGKFI